MPNHKLIIHFISVVGLFRYYLENGATVERILKVGASLCNSLKLQPPNVCDSGVHLFGIELIRISQQLEMSATEICLFVLDEKCAQDAENLKHVWNITLPPFSKPEIQELPLPRENAARLKVLHLSDTHYDPWYVVGSNANCDEPLCCRDGYAAATINAAGKWGGYKCDVPLRTLENLLDHILTAHKVYKIFTSRPR